jgi:SAM-dependent methyltransferase
MINEIKLFVVNIFFYILGLIFLLFVKIKYRFAGFPTSNLSNVTNYAKFFEYDIRVVDQWISHLNNYTGNNYNLFKKNVLELGPGSDLGVGFYLLYKGILKYNSCDIYNLVKNVPVDFYKMFFNRLQNSNGIQSVSYLEKQLEKISNNHPSDLNYVVNSNFNLLLSFEPNSIDIVFSQAAFEHFANVEDTVKQLSIVCKPNAIIIAEIDLQTHSRWIREKDPINIYRYNAFIYKLLSAKATPNRIRPYMYYELFKNYGWYDIKIIPLSNIDEKKRPPDRYLNKKFRDSKNEMSYLSIIFLAKKK